MSFRNLGLHDEIVQAVESMGYENPTPIQEQAITQILSDEPQDLIGLAQTGTGKTAAFGLPLLHLIDTSNPKTQGLVVCPTRELASQISNELTQYAQFMKNLKIAVVYGGTSIDQQIRAVKRGAHIIVATPGRLIDMINRKAVKLENVEVVVLDEADEMFNMGFQEDIDNILSYTPETKNTWLFSATMSKEVEKVAHKYMDTPVEIAVSRRNESARNIEHHYYVVDRHNKYPALKRVIDFYPGIFGVIFCRTRKETQEIAESLTRDGYNAEAIHGDLSQVQREQVMKKFRERSLQLLVATDVAARGIDVSDVTHVINYNLPDDLESYTHRSGRTARAGKSGTSIILTVPREVYRVKDLGRFIKKDIILKKVPTGMDVCQNQMTALVGRVKEVEVSEEEIGKFLPEAYEALQELTKEDLIQRFVSVEFNRFLDYYRGAADINARERRNDSRDRNNRSGDRRKGAGKERFGLKTAQERFFMNLGEIDDLNKGALVRMICDRTGINSANLGSIDLKREYTFFDVEKKVAGKILTQLHGTNYKGRKVKVEVAQKKRGGRRHQ
ncbi:DEAD/DEAH box helicase [Algivirga pacifica]|uniref:DEAD/DEAH box helicase n=1 Tax=Algivirga pacifica TaxID=1162670 RepID=A0ABP9D0C2_9BACT